MSYLLIFLTIFLTVYGQLVIKWQVNMAGQLPTNLITKIEYALNILLNPWTISALIAYFMAVISWIFAITKIPLSYAYPFMSLSFVLVTVFSNFFLNESITNFQKIGLFLIVLGVALGGQK